MRKFIRYERYWAANVLSALGKAPGNWTDVLNDLPMPAKKGPQQECWYGIAYLADPDRYRREIRYMAASGDHLSRRLAYTVMTARKDRSAMATAISGARKLITVASAKGR